MEGALPLLSPQTAVKYTAIQVSIPPALIIIPFKLNEFLEVTYCFRKIILKIYVSIAPKNTSKWSIIKEWN